jgi:hypothetical protein
MKQQPRKNKSAAVFKTTRGGHRQPALHKQHSEESGRDSYGRNSGCICSRFLAVYVPWRPALDMHGEKSPGVALLFQVGRAEDKQNRVGKAIIEKVKRS